MSADNFVCIRKHIDGGFVVSMEFASNDDIPVIATDKDIDGRFAGGKHTTFEDALDAALEWEQEDYFEYGLCIMVKKEDRR